MNTPLKLKLHAKFSSNPIVVTQKPAYAAASFHPVNQGKRISVAQTQSSETSSTTYNVEFKTLGECRLGISSYPDFEYNAQGGAGKGVGTPVVSEGETFASFDPEELYIPPLSSRTTRFLGLPLPPFLKIEVVPELFQGRINTQSGQVDLEFKAKFWFSIGSIYRAPPLLVVTVLTSEESRGEMRSGRGKRLDKEGKCRLVGVARVDPIDDLLMNTFLQLPTECLASLNAVISFPNQSS